jgi:hypothetical protein
VKKTGGGPRPKPISQQSEKVLAIVPTQMHSLQNDIVAKQKSWGSLYQIIVELTVFKDTRVMGAPVQLGHNIEKI